MRKARQRTCVRRRISSEHQTAQGLLSGKSPRKRDSIANFLYYLCFLQLKIKGHESTSQDPAHGSNATKLIKLKNDSYRMETQRSKQLDLLCLYSVCSVCIYINIELHRNWSKYGLNHRCKYIYNICSLLPYWLHRTLKQHFTKSSVAWRASLISVWCSWYAFYRFEPNAIKRDETEWHG